MPSGVLCFLKLFTDIPLQIVTVLSMAPEFTRDKLTECLAMGADEAFLLSDAAFGGADTYATSYVLAKAIERLGAFDLILFGISGAAHHLCGISDSDVIVNINCEKAADSLAASDFIGVMDAGEVIDRLLEMLETVPVL